MRNRGELPSGWILILVGVILVVIASPSFFLPVGHFESGYYATIDINPPRNPTNISSLPAECQQLAHHLADGQNVSEKAYEIRVLGTTYTMKNTNISNQAVDNGDIHGGLSNWHLGDTYCGHHIKPSITYHIDGESYRFHGDRLYHPNFWHQHRGYVYLLLLTGMGLIFVGRRVRRRSDSQYD